MRPSSSLSRQRSGRIQSSSPPRTPAALPDDPALEPDHELDSEPEPEPATHPAKRNAAIVTSQPATTTTATYFFSFSTRWFKNTNGFGLVFIQSYSATFRLNDWIHFPCGKYSKPDALEPDAALEPEPEPDPELDMEFDPLPDALNESQRLSLHSTRSRS